MTPNTAMVHKHEGQVVHAVVYLGQSRTGDHMGLEWSLWDQKWRVTWWKHRFWVEMITSGEYQFPCKVDETIRGCCAIPKPEGYKQPKESIPRWSGETVSA